MCDIKVTNTDTFVANVRRRMNSIQETTINGHDAVKLIQEMVKQEADAAVSADQDPEVAVYFKGVALAVSNEQLIGMDTTFVSLYVDDLLAFLLYMTT